MNHCYHQHHRRTHQEQDAADRKSKCEVLSVCIFLPPMMILMAVSVLVACRDGPSNPATLPILIVTGTDVIGMIFTGGVLHFRGCSFIQWFLPLGMVLAVGLALYATIEWVMLSFIPGMLFIQAVAHVALAAGFTYVIIYHDDHPYEPISTMTDGRSSN